MAVARRTPGSCPSQPRRVDPVENLIDPVFLRMNACLHATCRCSVKTRCYFLGYRGFGKKISGKLFDAKPVEGHVCVHGLNDPVPKRPTVPS